MSARVKLTAAIAAAIVVSIVGAAFLLGDEPAGTGDEEASVAGSGEQDAVPHNDAPVAQPDAEPAGSDDPDPVDENVDAGDDASEDPGNDEQQDEDEEDPPVFTGLSLTLRADACNELQASLLDTPGDEVECSASTSFQHYYFEAAPHDTEVPAGTAVQAEFGLKTTPTNPVKTRYMHAHMEYRDGSDWVRAGTNAIAIASDSSVDAYVAEAFSFELDTAIPADTAFRLHVMSDEEGGYNVASSGVKFDGIEFPNRLVLTPPA